MGKLAVLTSGGLDSSVLLADMARDAEVWPVYVRSGLAWEDEERRAVDRFVAALDSPNVRPLIELSAPMGQIYGDHWAMTGVDVPKHGDADDAVFMPGRNIVLIGLAAVWCSTRGVGAVAIGSLGGNPFPRRHAGVLRGLRRRPQPRTRPRNHRPRALSGTYKGRSHPRERPPAPRTFSHVHDTCGRPPLRSVPKVRGTHGRLHRSRRRGQYAVRHPINVCYPNPSYPSDTIPQHRPS